MLCRVFYYLSAPAEEIPSSRPIDLPAGQVWSDLVACLEGVDDYVGLVDAADNVLQITREEEVGAYWVELPMPDEHVSYGRRMSEADAGGAAGHLQTPRFSRFQAPALAVAPLNIVSPASRSP